MLIPTFTCWIAAWACIPTGVKTPKPSNRGGSLGEWIAKVMPASTKPRLGSSMNSS